MLMKVKVPLIATAIAAATAGGLFMLTADEKQYDATVVHGRFGQPKESTDGKTLEVSPSVGTIAPIETVRAVGPVKHEVVGKELVLTFVPPPSPPPCPPTPSPCPTATPVPTPSPDPTKTPGPTPTPTASMPPSPPGPAKWGLSWPWKKPLPSPPPVSGAPQPGDPTGLMREGMGADAKGGAGTLVVRVTAAGPDGAPGTVRDRFENLTPGARIIEFDQAVADGPPVILDTPLVSKEPYVTLDCKGGSIKPKSQNTNGLGWGATHDIVVKNCRFLGHFNESQTKNEWVPQQNSGNGFLDGDVNALPCKSWDTKCQEMDPALRRAVTSIIFDQCTWDRIQDDAIGLWGGARMVSFLRNLVLRSFHPSTTGWKGELTSEALMRLWNSWHYNVLTLNGERNGMYPREGTHWYFFDRNFVADWKWYKFCKTKVNGVCTVWEWNSPYGTRLSGQAPGENDMGWMRANCFVGTKLGMPLDSTGKYAPTKEMTFNATKPNQNLTWGGTVDNGGCDDAPNCCAPSCDKFDGANIECCNPRAKTNHYVFEKNEGEVWDWMGGNNPFGYVPPPTTYTPNLTKSWVTVLNESGVQKRTPDEAAEIARLIARVPECKVPILP